MNLSKEERSAIKQNILNFISQNPVRPDIQPRLNYGSSIFLTKLSFAPIMAILLILVVLAGGGVAVGAERALPGDILYPVKVGLSEEVRGWLSVSEESKANWEVERAQRRLEEAETLASEGSLDVEAREKVEANFEIHAEKVKQRIQKFENKENFKAAVNVSSKFETSLKAHNKILSRISTESEANVKKEVKPIQAKVRSEAVNAIRTRKKMELRASSQKNSENIDVKYDGYLGPPRESEIESTNTPLTEIKVWGDDKSVFDDDVDEVKLDEELELELELEL